MTGGDDTLHTWFARSVERHRHAPALVVGERTVSYLDLLDLVDRVAARLVHVAGRLPRTVALCASRSLAAYVGYLASVRLGAAVVPLAPAVPAGRNRAICRASAVDVLVADDTGHAVAAAVAASDGIPLAALLDPPGRRWQEALPEPWTEPPTARADDIAYVLFTSGSTGEPKGVPVRHRNLTGFLAHVIDRYQVGPGARLSQTFELTFDPSVFDMFVAWLSGATLVAATRDEVLSPVRYVNTRQITHWYSVPSVISLARRLRLLRPGCMPDLRWSLFAGEQLTVAQARVWADAAPGSTLENLYGPTELTVTCTEYRLPADRALWPRTSNDTVPIGRVYPHLDGVVLAESGTVTDDGELCVRGSQRFGGYLDPAQDHGRFVRREGDDRAVPVDGSPGPVDWYRTGDRVRVENGELVHCGRLDDQLKIHGHRVELGEIESVLRRHRGVEDVVVLGLPASPDDVELFALFVGEDVDVEALTSLAEGRLPAYMRPRRYHRVDRFPVGANGKIDRKRLAADARTL